MSDFSGKVILITGASSGIGAGTAELFAKLGANLSLIGRNVENLAKTVDCCKKANDSVKIFPIQADVTTDAKRIVEETIKHYGKLNVLINNAGILAYGSILEIDGNQFDEVLNTNVRSVFELSRLSIPHLIKTEGNIVNVSSVAGLRSFPNCSNYCMSKAAVDQFTRCIALELAPMKVRVNAVNPGVIVTDIHKRGGGMTEQDYKLYLERCKATHALGRVGNVEDVASAIVFLAGDGASFITGACLPIDGGKHAMCPR